MKTFLRKQDEDSAGSASFGRPPLGPPAVSDRQDAQRASPLSADLSKPTRQFADMVLAPVDPQKRAALEAKLRVLNEQTKNLMRGKATLGERGLPFDQVEGLHFARLVLLDLGGRPMLALATDYDGPEADSFCSAKRARRKHFEELARLPGMSDVFAHCLGSKPAKLNEYFHKHSQRASTSFVAAPGRSVRQILAEAKLRRDIEAVLGSTRVTGATPEQVRLDVLAALAPQYGKIAPFPAQPDTDGQIKWYVRGALGAVGAGVASVAACVSLPLGALGLSGYGLSLALTTGGSLVLLGLAVLRLRWLETHDAQWQPKYDGETHELVAKATRDENIFLQNQLTHVVEIKSGPLRWLLIRAVFAALQVLATKRYNRGKLGDIPSIHFARWVLGPQRTLIFFSNFDSSWQSYLGDFIDKASSGLTAVWSNTKLYPRTDWLLTAGSRDAGRFLAWTRAHQKPTQVWYSRYPGLSVVNINANTEIRRGLVDPETLDAVSWLARLRNVDRTEVDQRYGEDQVRHRPLELGDIQGIILKGYGHKSVARYLLLTVEQSSPLLLQWLAQLPVTSALTGSSDNDAPDPLLNVAFTYAGLTALGLEKELCDAFSTPFVQGSPHPGRAQINGDVALDAPEHWDWGKKSEQIKPVHVALLIFATDAESLTEQVKIYRSQAEQHGLAIVTELDAGTLEGRKEHFGFRDGIAQPVVEGSGDPGVEKNTIAAGEFLLGHKNGYGNVVAAPTSRQGFRFGFNGSYMVLRQLEQDVAAFWTYCRDQAALGPLTAIQVASKMMGRWPSGAPLVRYPEKDPGGMSDDDAFGYFEAGVGNDRYGGRCPFGAHIRRTNPRDWGLGESTEESTRLSNLHRIMRRGRPYGAPLIETMKPTELCQLVRDMESETSQAGGARKPAVRGLQFMCFNANIERQFEFIQQQWCKNPKFAGQNSDADPVLGISQCPEELGIDGLGMTIQSDVHGSATKRLQGLTSFVSLRGSAYLFMPSVSALRLLPRLVESPTAPASAPSYETVPDDEQLHIDRLIDNIRLMLQRRYAGKQTLRDAHPKMHGFVQAVLEVDDQLAPTLRHGLFAAAGKKYRGWVRFSSEHHDPQSDHKRDTRGLALKLLDIPGDKLLDGEESSPCHDFIFLSAARFVAHDVAGFSETVNALVNNSWLSWLRSVPAVVRLVLSSKKATSPLETEYFSVVPYLLGPHAVKYIVTPQRKTKRPRPPESEQDFLRKALDEQLAEDDYCFDVFVQTFVDQKTTPVEDPAVRWTVRGQKVATLRIPRQVGFNRPAQRQIGEDQAFNPFRCLPEHRPLGGINRARRQVYQAIAAFRHARNGVTSVEVPPWPDD